MHSNPVHVKVVRKVKGSLAVAVMAIDRHDRPHVVNVIVIAALNRIDRNVYRYEYEAPVIVVIIVDRVDVFILYPNPIQ